MEIIKPRTLSGFMELLPGKQLRFEKMTEILRATYASYGFAPLDTPVIEDAQILLAKHNLFATATTGRLIADNTGLPITLLLSHKQGGHQQINARIAYNEIDLVLLFTDPNTTEPWDDSQMIETIRHCDKQNVPIATNLASAEMLIMGLQLGDLDWREMLHSKNRY